MNQGDKITITIEYGEPLCVTCKHQVKAFDETPCDACSISEILYEPKEETQCL